MRTLPFTLFIISFAFGGMVASQDAMISRKSPVNHLVLNIIDSIAVHKAERTLSTFSNNKLLKTYHISLGYNPKGPKQFQGDGKTPEGLYYIDGKDPNSDYHKNLGISYPTPAERSWAREFGRSAGGDIKIHGLPNGYVNKPKRHMAPDWTIGCIAVTNKEIDELYETVEIGTPILITP